MKTNAGKVAASALAAAMVFGGALALTGCDNGKQTNTEKNAAKNTNKENANTAANTTSANTPAADSNVITQPDPESPYSSGKHTAIMTVEGYDPITIELDADAAPITVQNFCELVNQGFYNGLTFYRIVPNFCLQGGSSNNSAAVVDDGLSKIKGEFSANGVSNPLADSFEKGTVAMARSTEDSATSTFFVTLGSDANVSASLNGKYAAFGKIDEKGMETIDKIVADYSGSVDNPSSGAISDVSKQAKISSISLVE